MAGGELRVGIGAIVKAGIGDGMRGRGRREEVPPASLPRLSVGGLGEVGLLLLRRVFSVLSGWL